MFTKRPLFGLVWLAALAIFMRALIPQGYMPAMGEGQAGGHMFQMVVCSLDGPKTITVQADFDPHSDLNTASHEAPHHSEKSQDHCVFALLAHVNMMMALDDMLLHPVAIPLDRVVVPYMSYVKILDGQTQSRAPPVFS